MEMNTREVKSSEINEHLFKDESNYQKNRSAIYLGLVAFTVLLVVTFLLLNTGIAFALTCGVSIGISASILVLSLVRIGSKSFWVFFAWSLTVLICVSWFGLPEFIHDKLISLGVSKDIIILGTIGQVVLFFLYFIFVQNKDLKKLPLDIDSEDIRIDKKLSKKKVEKKKVNAKPSKKTVFKKFSFTKEKVDGISENFEEPEEYARYRKSALKVGLSAIVLTAVVLSITLGVSYLMPFAFISMFAVLFLLMLIPMIKPGSKKFWYGFLILLVTIVPTFIIAVNL